MKESQGGRTADSVEEDTPTVPEIMSVLYCGGMREGRSFTWVEAVDVDIRVPCFL
jgi:hypothetical protein